MVPDSRATTNGEVTLSAEEVHFLFTQKCVTQDDTPRGLFEKLAEAVDAFDDLPPDTPRPTSQPVWCAKCGGQYQCYCTAGTRETINKLSGADVVTNLASERRGETAPDNGLGVTSAGGESGLPHVANPAPPSSETNCPMCGSEVTVSGNGTTQYFIPKASSETIERLLDRFHIACQKLCQSADFPHNATTQTHLTSQYAAARSSLLEAIRSENKRLTDERDAISREAGIAEDEVARLRSELSALRSGKMAVTQEDFDALEQLRYVSGYNPPFERLLSRLSPPTSKG